MNAVDSLVPLFIFHFVFHTLLPMLFFHQGIVIYHSSMSWPGVYGDRGYEQKKASSGQRLFLASDQHQIHDGCLFLYCPLKQHSSTAVCRQGTQIPSFTRLNFGHFMGILCSSCAGLGAPGSSRSCHRANQRSEELTGLRREKWDRLTALWEAGTVIKAGSN